MRRLCVAVALTLCVGIGHDSMAQGERDIRPELPDVPTGFRFLFLSPEENVREGQDADGYWAGLPYDSISLERGSTGGCARVCSSYQVTFQRGPIPGDPRPLRTRGRAELRAVAPENMPGRPVDRSGDFAGSIDLWTYAQLSYLLQRLRFLDLPDRYDSEMARQDHLFTIVSVAASGRTKAVVDYGEGRPVELWAIQQAIDAAAHRITWTTK